MPADPYAKIVRDGKTLDALTDGALKRAEKTLGRRLAIAQGSYNAGKVSASAGTHDGGGAIDVPAGGWEQVVPALRAAGFAAWYRPTLPGVWSAHIHAVLIGNARLSPSAARQVDAYLARRDGLVSNRADTDPGWTGTARYTATDLAADLKREERLAKLETARARKAKWQRWVKRANKNIARLKGLTK